MKTHLIRKSAICFSLAVAVILTIKLAWSPINTLKKYENIEPARPTDDALFSVSEIDSLSKLIAHKQARLLISQSDSIQMIIDLAEKRIFLQLKGVNIFTSRIHKMEEDPLLDKLARSHYFSLFSKPIKVTEIYATIVKEPIVERQAPKDTLEAALNAYLPDTLVQFPAFLRLRTEHGINIFINQSSIQSYSEWNTHRRFHVQHAKERFKTFSKSLFGLESFYYEPSITMCLPVDDLRAIYRALPSKPEVVIRLK